MLVHTVPAPHMLGLYDTKLLHWSRHAPAQCCNPELSIRTTLLHASPPKTEQHNSARRALPEYIDHTAVFSGNTMPGWQAQLKRELVHLLPAISTQHLQPRSTLRLLLRRDFD